ncbi:N-acetylmuramic acid 6-phosphate etherase [Streptomyces purpurascens]
MTSTSDPRDLRTELESLTTEAFRPELADIDRLPTLDIARLMNGEDATVAGAVAARLPQIAAAIDAVAERMARGGRLVYAGAGTAGRLGILDASECPPTFNTDPSRVVGLIAGGPEAMVTSVEGAEDSRELARADLETLGLTPDDTVVGVSASGRTPYALGAGPRTPAPAAPSPSASPATPAARSGPPPTTASRSSWAPNCSPAPPA